MKKLFLIFIFCLLFTSSAFGQKKVVTHHTDLIDSPTSYVIPYGNVLFTVRTYSLDSTDAQAIINAGHFPGAGILLKFRATPFPRLSFGASLKWDNFIACGLFRVPGKKFGIQDVIGPLIRYRIMDEPVSFAIGLDYIAYARFRRTRGFYGVLGTGYANKVFPYIGGNITWETEGVFYGAFGGAEIAPIGGLNIILDVSYLEVDEKWQFFLDAGLRGRLTEGLWIEANVRNIFGAITGKKDWNRMIRMWYEWRAPPPPRR
jgi:hypothetical protein